MCTLCDTCLGNRSECRPVLCESEISNAGRNTVLSYAYSDDSAVNIRFYVYFWAYRQQRHHPVAIPVVRFTKPDWKPGHDFSISASNQHHGHLDDIMCFCAHIVVWDDPIVINTLYGVFPVYLVTVTIENSSYSHEVDPSAADPTVDWAPCWQ